MQVMFDPDPPTNLVFLINDCRWQLSQLIDYKLLHCQREYNAVTDALAKEENITNAAFTTFTYPPPFTLQVFQKDLPETVYARTCFNYSYVGRETGPNMPLVTTSFLIL